MPEKTKLSRRRRPAIPTDLKKKIWALPLMMVIASSASHAEDDTRRFTACAFAPGDPVDKVKQFYGVADSPKVLWRVQGGGNVYQYNVKKYGVTLFLDVQQRVAGIRFTAPFRGRIGGIVLGDTAARVRSLHGAPAQQVQGNPDTEHLKTIPRQTQVLLDALPDPAPKSMVLKTFADIQKLWRTPILFDKRWVYDPGKRSVINYDLGAEDNRVDAISVHDCMSVPHE